MTVSNFFAFYFLMSIHLDATPAARFQPRWLMMSVLLLAVYLGFFHFCVGAEYRLCIAAGVIGFVAWQLICSLFRLNFLNRFEYRIHQFVGIDILLEGFVPFHEGFGFYYCASCFWLILLSYHAFGSRRNQLLANDLPVESPSPSAAELPV